MSGYRGILIGCGFFASNHLHGWADLPDASIAAVCDLDADKARQLADTFGIDRHGTDIDKLIAQIEPHFVDIATTTPSHLPLVRTVAAPGRLVICQKPMADSVADARAMVTACETAGATLIIHENFRWQAPFRDAMRIVATGQIGTVDHARFSFRHGYDNYINQPYLAKTERFAISDVGTHLFDLLQAFCGPAASVSCATQRRNPIIRGEDSFAALVTHQSGAVSVADCSFESRLTPHRFPQTTGVIEGTAGVIEIAEDYMLTVHGPTGRRTFSAEPSVPGWGVRPWHVVQESVVAFQRHAIAVLDGASGPMPSGRFTVGTVALVDAAYLSAAEGRRVTLQPQEVT